MKRWFTKQRKNSKGDIIEGEAGDEEEEDLGEGQERQKGTSDGSGKVVGT